MKLARLMFRVGPAQTPDPLFPELPSVTAPEVDRVVMCNWNHTATEDLGPDSRTWLNVCSVCHGQMKVLLTVHTSCSQIIHQVGLAEVEKATRTLRFEMLLMLRFGSGEESRQESSKVFLYAKRESLKTGLD